MNLKPCPFCGGEAKFQETAYSWSNVVCDNCGAMTTCVMNSAHYSSKEVAIEAWNRRVTMTDREAIEYFEAIFETEALGKTDIEAMNIAISALKKREERAMNWISVKERLPQDKQKVIVAKKNPYNKGASIIDIAMFEKKGRYELERKKNVFFYIDSEAGFVQHGNVTHWMPLPEPPKEET